MKYNKQVFKKSSEKIVLNNSIITDNNMNVLNKDIKA